MDQSLIKNVDEIGEETERYISMTHGHVVCKPVRFTPSTSNNIQDYYIKSDNQARVEPKSAIPLYLPPKLNKTPGIILADGKHYASHRSCFRSLRTTTNIFFRKQSPSATPPYPKKGVYKNVTRYTNSIYIPCKQILMSYYLKIT
ncbi:unnamed protein product [marine sediment metagenome]|uniref:Uncharacterized protein n=1 Tax=marine sediment metagenome TaxID=412755 RepID=X0ZWZ2_9ZZZZ